MKMQNLELHTRVIVLFLSKHTLNCFIGTATRRYLFITQTLDCWGRSTFPDIINDR